MRRLALAALFLTTALPAFAEDVTVATVNGEAVTLAQMQAMAAGLGEQAAGLSDAALWGMLLDQLTQQTAMAQEGAVTATPADRATVELTRRAYYATAALQKIAAPEPSAEELQVAYDATYPADAPVTEYNASHILVQSREAADAAVKDLAAGQEFGAVAEARSTGTSGPNKGELGWFTADMMVEPFAKAVQALDVGQVSEPVETQFGWHVIRLNDSRVKARPTFEEVREPLVQQIRRDRVEAEVKRVTEAAKVETVEGIDPAQLRAVQ